ncbi:tRNA (adenine-N1)-methyltransferase [Stetteria hydrogenophila]
MVLLFVVSGERRRGYLFRAVESAVYSTFAGVVRGADLAGARWGSRLELQRGVAYVLPPSRYDLMIHDLERATQVIYPKDQGFMVSLAGVGPGMRILEAGVGSGFLTAALAAATGCRGRVVGYDVRRDAIEATRRNLEALGLGGCVELRLGDVRNGVPGEEFDAVFLDMPDPWEALQALRGSVRPGGSAVVFVPTYNQLEKLLAVDGDGWVFINAYEVLVREIEVKRGAVRPSPQMTGHTGFIALLRRVDGGSSG